jgi:hypothetical protein
MGCDEPRRRIGVVRPEELGEVRGLWRNYAASLPFDLGYQGFETEIGGLPAPYGAPHGMLLVARTTAPNPVVGTVGLRRLCAILARSNNCPPRQRRHKLCDGSRV